MPTRWVLALQFFWIFGPMHQNIVPLRGGGGVCVHFLKSVRKGRFRNVWVRGEIGGHIFEHRAGNGTVYTKHALQSLDHSLFGFRIVVLVAPLHKGWDSIRADMFVNRNIFLQFSPILQPACLHRHPACIERHGPQAVSCEVNIVLFGQPDLAIASL